MKRFTFAMLALIGSACAIHAQQWGDLVQFGNLPENKWGNATSTDATVAVDLFTCPNGSSAFVNGYNLQAGCSPTNTIVDVNINQFARQRDLLGLSDQLTSLNAQFSAMKAQFAQALQIEAHRSYSGVAQALAMAGTLDLRPDENYAISMNVGTFRGQTAFAGGAVARLSDHWSFNAGITAGANGGTMGTRAGIRFGW